LVAGFVFQVALPAWLVRGMRKAGRQEKRQIRRSFTKEL
jgi:hypothetical protein